MARDPETIQREIKQTRDALAEDLDALSERTSPQRFVDRCRTSVQQRLADPKVKYGLVAVGVLIAYAVLRKLFADADAPSERFVSRSGAGAPAPGLHVTGPGSSIEQRLESRLDGLDGRLARIEEQLHRVAGLNTGAGDRELRSR